MLAGTELSAMILLLVQKVSQMEVYWGTGYDRVGGLTEKGDFSSLTLSPVYFTLKSRAFFLKHRSCSSNLVSEIKLLGLVG